MSEAILKVDAALPSIELDRPSPRAVINQATEEANVLAEVIDGQGLYSTIQGKKFVKVEGWVTLATLRGCLPREVKVTEMDFGRYVAEVELVRMSDGMVLTKASAECGGEEDPVWSGRPPNARRSMAITRATGKACRIAFSWVMALSGFEVTPEEEMEGAYPPRSYVPIPTVAPAVTPNIHAHGDGTISTNHPNFVINFGTKYKGKKLSEVDSGYLHFLIGLYERDIKDSEKSNYIVGNRSKLNACLLEKQHRDKTAPAADEPPHPANDPSELFP
jgi:hypothetical protein